MQNYDYIPPLMQLEGFLAHNLRDRTFISYTVSISYAHAVGTYRIWQQPVSKECCSLYQSKKRMEGGLYSHPGSNLFGAMTILCFDVHVWKRPSIARLGRASEQTLVIVTDQNHRRPK